MSRPSPQDYPRIAATVMNAGQLLELEGGAVRERLVEWRRGPKAANLDPDAGGWRYECERCGQTKTQLNPCDCDAPVWPVPGDSTGEAAVSPDAVDGMLARYDKAVTALAAAAQEVHTLHGDVLRSRAAVKVVDDPTKWCRPHLALGICEPRWRGDLCRFDYDFKAAHGVEAPREILLARHRGLRVTEAMVDEALGKAKRRKKAG